MKRKILFAWAIASLVGSSEAHALSCFLRANVPDGSQVVAPFRILADVICSDFDAPDARLFYTWAPPMPSGGAGSSFVLNYAGVAVGPVQVTELGNCVEQIVPICEPEDPGCGRDNRSVPVFDRRKLRKYDFYRRFKRVLVPGARNGRDLVCEVLANILTNNVTVQVKQTCEPNCYQPPLQGPGGDPITTPCPPSPPPQELPIVLPPVSPPIDPPVERPPGDQQLACEAKPVNIVTGAMWHKSTDFIVAGRTKGAALALERTYSAAPARRPTAFGNRWHFNYESNISPVAGSADLDWIDESGGANRFTRLADGSFRAPLGQTAVLVELEDHYELRKTDRTVLFFNKLDSPIGKLYQIRDVYGESVTLQYDEMDRLSTVSSPFAGSISFTYNDFGYISTVRRDRDNLTYTYDYDSKFRLAAITDFQSRRYTYTYIDDKETLATQDLLASITDPIGRKTWFTYDELGRANNQYEPGGAVWTFRYGNRQTTVTEPNGAVTTYFFDENLRETKRVTPDGGRHYKSWQNGRLTALKSEFGGTPRWTYDSNGNPTSVLRPEDRLAKQTTYDLNFNRPTMVQPAEGAPTHFTLDPQTGDITKISRGGLSLQFTYDQFGNLLSTSNGRTTYANQRNSNGLLTYVFDLHNPQTLTYDLRGRVSSRNFLSGRTITYSYNDDDQITVIADSHGPTTVNAYDMIGRLTKVSVTADGQTQETITQYDERDRIISTTDALGRTTRFSYDNIQVRNFPVEITDPAGRVTKLEYDALDRVTKRTDPAGGVTKFSYDLRGNLTAVTDANGNSTRYKYDLNNRKVKEIRPSIAGTSPADRVHLFFYDSADRLTREILKSSTGANDRAVIYEHDALGRKVRKIVQREGAGTVVEDDSHFTYEDQLDTELLKTATNGIASLAFSNEAAPPFHASSFSVTATQAGNPLGLIQGTFEVARDVSGEVASISKDGTSLYSKTYDPFGRLTGVTSVGFSASVGYDGFGRKTNVVYSSGETGTFERDLLDRILKIKWTGSTPISETLTYDQAGNVSTLVRENGATSISYDSNDQVVSSTGQYSRSFTYDFLGNRLQDSANGPGSFVSNFLVSNGSSSFLSDPDGFGETVLEATASSAKTFEYRADGLMSAAHSGPTQARYFFDALGRRVAKAVTVGSMSFYQAFVHFDKEDRILLGKAGDGSISTYIDGQGVDEHLGEVKGGVGKGYLTDHLGSVLNGEAAGTARFFGLFGESNPTGGPGLSSSPVSYGFTGRELDIETGLNYHRARIYSPNVGRWLSQDPLGMSAGDPNYYRYVGNRPITLTDPTGLDSAQAEQLGAEARRILQRAQETQFRCGSRIFITLTQLWVEAEIVKERSFGIDQCEADNQQILPNVLAAQNIIEGSAARCGIVAQFRSWLRQRNRNRGNI